MRNTGVEWNALGAGEAVYLGHDEFVDDPALAVVDGDLVSGDGSGGRSGRLLQLRGGARPRVPGWAVREQGRGTDEDAGAPLAPPHARSSPRPDASPAGSNAQGLPSAPSQLGRSREWWSFGAGEEEYYKLRWLSWNHERRDMGGVRECTYVVAAGQAIVRPSASDLVEERVRPAAGDVLRRRA